MNTKLLTLLLVASLPALAAPEAVTVKKSFAGCITREDLKVYDSAMAVQDNQAVYKLTHDGGPCKWIIAGTVVYRDKATLSSLSRLRVKGDTTFRWGRLDS